MGFAGELWPSDRDRMLEAEDSRQARFAKAGWMVTALATQTLIPGGTGRLWMEWAPLLSSQDGPRRVQLEGFGPDS